MHLVGERQFIGEIAIDPRMKDIRPTTAGPLDRCSRASSLSARRTVIRLQPYRSARSRSVGSRSPGRHSPEVQGVLEVQVDLVVQRDGTELESEAGHLAVRTSLAGRGGEGLVPSVIADNVISNGVKPDGSATEESMGVKIAVVGGGSTYTPELIEGFEARRDRLPIDEIVLLDVDPERLAIVGGLAQRMLDRLDWTGRLICTDDRDAAIDGADFVLIQLASAVRRPGSSMRHCP